jgi:hypothetical protein
MNNLRIVALCILMVGLIVGACGGGKETKFELTGGFSQESMIGGDLVSGTFTCFVEFTVTDVATLTLTNPEGKSAPGGLSMGSTDRPTAVKVDETNSRAYFDISSGYDIPKGGTYALTAKDASDKVIATETRQFSAADLSVSEISILWTWDGSYYTLKWLTVTVDNNGDLPTWVSTAEVSIDGKSTTLPIRDSDESYCMGRRVVPDAVDPLQTVNLYDVNLGGLQPGEKTVSLQIRDSRDSIACSYSTTVTPSE